MRAQEFITEITRRDFLRGAGALAGSAAVGQTQAQTGAEEIEEMLEDAAYLFAIMSKHLPNDANTINLERSLKNLQRTKYGTAFSEKMQTAQQGILIQQNKDPEQYKKFARYFIQNYQRIKDGIDSLQDLLTENKQATAQQVLAYVNKTHHEPMTSKLATAVSAHPRWELRQVSLQDLYIPDQDYQDPEQEPPRDPYDRVMAVDPDHASEYSTKIIDRRPIVIDDQGYIIDGNHRAWAAAELMNRDSIPAWVPVKQSMAEYREPKVQQAHRDGIDLEAWRDGLHFQIDATAHGRDLGRVVFDVQFQGKDTILVAQDLMILPEYRGQGIAAIMYDYAKELGYVVERSPEQTDAGKSFWDKNRGEEATVWENFADGKKPGRKGLSKRVGIPKKASLTQLQKIASSSTGERRRMAQWQLNMRRGKAKKK
jgi:GNAT superfamily N-acetyltransferase